MPKNYKTYASPKSFSEFQLRVPDQTGKIEEQTKRTIRGAEKAQQFQRENQEIYLRAQRLVNSAEDQSRETNYRMQSLERQSYKDALDRDYAIELDNISNASKAAQNNLKNIQAFSQTAVSLLGDYMKAEEERKVAAAHDVISRTGVTYDQMVAFQKMDDNLTRSEFAAQDNVQQMLGPDADPTLLNAFFTVYENRNTKRWLEHKQLFQNSLNKFPEFLEEKIRQATLETGETPSDFEGLLTEAKREFMDINFVGKARPEVLSGAGVYAKLNELVDSRRNLFLKDQRAARKEELSQDRQRAFHVEMNQNGVAGMIRWNSTNPSAQKREDWLEMLKDRAKMSGAYALDEDDIDAILTTAGGGSNGQTIQEAFPGFAADLEDIRDDIIDRREQDQNREDRALNREIDATATTLLNEKGADGELTEAERADVETQIFALYGGRTSTILENAKRITSDAQKARATELENEALWRSGRFNLEIAKSGFYLNAQDQLKWYRLAEESEKLSADPTTQLHLSQIEAAIQNRPEVLEAKSVYGSDYNEINHTLATRKYKQLYKKALQDFSAVPNTSFNKARQQAFDFVSLQIDKDIRDITKFDDKGTFTEFNLTSVDQQQSANLKAVRKTGEAQLLKIKNIIYDGTKDPSVHAELIAKEMNQAEIEQALKTFTERHWTMPPAIEYVAEITNRTPLQVLSMVAPYIGDGKLTVETDALNKAQQVRLKDFVATPYTPLRTRYRTPERTGRANVGDTKTGASAPIRPSMFQVVQYVSGDPAIRGKSTADRRIVYDNGDGPRGHGGKNYHNHYEFATQEQAARAKELFERNGYRVTSYLRLYDTGSAHSRGVAIDVAPPVTLPYTDEAEAAWSAGANALIGFDPLANE